jgi:ubiquinone/menaquinone biosynthesis C-methylase UbiE
MKSFKEALHSQFGNPSGIPGRLVGWLMSRKNRYRIRYALEVMKVQPDQLILEIGCGPGVAVSLLASRLVTGNITAIDHSALMVGMARKRNRKNILAGRVTLLEGTLHQVEVLPNHFDIIFAINVHLFWDKPVSELCYIREFLKQQGKVFVFFHPHWEKENLVVHTIGHKMLEDLKRARFIDTKLLFHPMHPVDCIVLEGTKPKPSP